MATTTFTPLHDRILVRRTEEGETVRGGIIIPDSAKEKPQQGEVVSVGKGKSNDEGKVFPLARGRSPRHRQQVVLRTVLNRFAVSTKTYTDFAG
jgi:hypothetical protein